MRYTSYLDFPAAKCIAGFIVLLYVNAPEDRILGHEK